MVSVAFGPMVRLPHTGCEALGTYAVALAPDPPPPPLKVTVGGAV